MVKSKKLSSYQKLKIKYEQEIAELTKDIITLVENKDSSESLKVKTNWEMKLMMEKSLWFGEFKNKLL